MTTVVHVRDVLDRLKAGDPEVVYVGRANARYGLRQSKWANPFVIGEDGNRENVVRLYAQWVRGATDGQRLLLDQVRDLRDKTLACWCAPLRCHGDVLAELAEALG